MRVMTDGILLAELQRDRDLRRYDTLIIDEAHERSLNIDFILGYVRQLLPRRPDLKVIVTSATIDTARFARHFGIGDEDAPIVEVTGRTYPVEVRYRPFGDQPDGTTRQPRPGAGDQRRRRRAGRRGRHARVPVRASGRSTTPPTSCAGASCTTPRCCRCTPGCRRSEQHRIFQPHRGRRIVLSTNVAETSITVPGVRTVVDTGTARISRYSRRLKVQRLPIEPVSQASANQRAGRCGRVAPGMCIRLYTEEDFDARPEFTEPEILRTNLASVILQMTAIGLGDVASFPFLEPPDRASIRDGYLLLEELGAIEQADDATAPPADADRPPPGPAARSTRGSGAWCSRPSARTASARSSCSPPRCRSRTRASGPRSSIDLANAAHKRFDVPGSDLLSILALWEHLRTQQRALSGNQFRRLCRTEFLNYLRVREWHDLFSQLRQVAGDLGIRPAQGRRRPGPHPPVRCSPGCCRTSGCATDDGRELPRRARLDVHDRPRLGARPQAAALGDGGRARRDEPAVGAPGGDDRAGVGRAARRAPRAALLRRAALGRAPRRGGDRRRPSRCTACRSSAGARCRTTASTAPAPAGCSSATPSCCGEWATHHAFVERNRLFRDRVQGLEARVRRGHLLDDDELQRVLRRAAARRRHVGAPLRPVVQARSATPRPRPHRRRARRPAPGSAPPTTRTRGARATSCCRCRTASTPAARSTAWPCTCR